MKKMYCVPIACGEVCTLVYYQSRQSFSSGYYMTSCHMRLVDMANCTFPRDWVVMVSPSAELIGCTWAQATCACIVNREPQPARMWPFSLGINYHKQQENDGRGSNPPLLFSSMQLL